jgi:hypothetical protein
MIRNLFGLTALALALAAPAAAQESGRGENPKLRAALHELREARDNLATSKDTWPPGYRERALASTQEAINTIRTILAVKDLDTFRGIDRDADYYNRYADHPRLRAALEDLRDAAKSCAAPTRSSAT